MLLAGACLAQPQVHQGVAYRGPGLRASWSQEAGWLCRAQLRHGSEPLGRAKAHMVLISSAVCRLLSVWGAEEGARG
jgi:hypothetical protein